MANKKTATKEKANLMDIRWINTPFAFVRVGKDFTLLQQQVLLKVSAHLQDYLSQFFKEGRHLSPDDPLNLFNEKTLPDIPVLKIPYREFNVGVNNRADLYQAIEEVMNVRIKAMVVEDGIPKVAWVNVFNQMATPLADISDVEYRNGNWELKINATVAAYAFNMRLGYVNHPAELASESTKIYAPRLYFLIKHKLPRGKTVATIRYEELREELGMNKVDKLTGEVVEKLYPLFSKFVKNVLDPAVEDINRMASLNLLDITVEYTINYPERVERGNPLSITFKVTLSNLGEFHKDPKKAKIHMDLSKVDETQPASRKRGRPRKEKPEEPQIPFEKTEPELVPGDKADIWKDLVREYGDGPLKDVLENVEYQGTFGGAFSLEFPDYKSRDEFFKKRDPKFDELLEKYLPDQFSHNRLKCSYKASR